MSEGFKNWFATTSSSSSKIFLFLVPLIIVSGCASLLAQKGSIWALIYTFPTSSSSSSNTNLDAVKKPSLQAKESDSPVDLQPSVVVSVDGRSRKEASSNEVAVLNNSASLPVVAQSSPAAAEALNDKNEDNPNMSISENFNSTSTSSIRENESTEPPLKPRRRRVPTSLERLEDGLRKARIAIREATNGSRLKDPDYIPDGPIYKNAKAFHRSYLEMEKQFKIFVYEEGEIPLFHDGPCMLLYTMEGQFINKMEVNKKFRTHNPEKAHVFYLPYSVTRMVQYIWVKGTNMKRLGRTVLDYVNVITVKHPYWNRSLGADHFMLSCHDWGPATSFYVPDLVKNSIRALCNANTSERFKPMKDVSIPEISLKSSRLEGLVGGPSPSQRTILAFFAGGNHGFVRPILFKHWGNKDPDIRVHDYLPKGVSYYGLMRQSKYCLCPSGYEVASPRAVEALYNGCVPVLISKSYVPPFSDVLNWKTFSVMVSLEEIPNLKTILMSITERQYIRMYKSVVQVRRHFELHADRKEEEENPRMPVQGPACNASNMLAGWHTFNTLPFAGKSAANIDDRATVLPKKLEWSEFVLNSRLLWKDGGDKQEWIRDIDMLDGDIESPLGLVKDPSVVEPLGSCGCQVLLWWLRVEARADSKFPPRWIIDPPMEITVPSKRTPWPDAPPELPANEKPALGVQEPIVKHTAKTRTSRSKRRSKRKHETRTDTQVLTRHSGQN